MNFSNVKRLSAIIAASSVIFLVSNARGESLTNVPQEIISELSLVPTQSHPQLPSTHYSAFITISGDFNTDRWSVKAITFESAETLLYKVNGFGVSLGGEAIDKKVSNAGLGFEFQPKESNLIFFISKQSGTQGFEMTTAGVKCQIW